MWRFLHPLLQGRPRPQSPGFCLSIHSQIRGGARLNGCSCVRRRRTVPRRIQDCRLDQGLGHQGCHEEYDLLGHGRRLQVRRKPRPDQIRSHSADQERPAGVPDDCQPVTNTMTAAAHTLSPRLSSLTTYGGGIPHFIQALHAPLAALFMTICALAFVAALATVCSQTRCSVMPEDAGKRAPVAPSWSLTSVY